MVPSWEPMSTTPRSRARALARASRQRELRLTRAHQIVDRAKSLTYRRREIVRSGEGRGACAEQHGAVLGDREDGGDAEIEVEVAAASREL